MEKINWDLSKEKFPEGTKSVIICNHCGWLTSSPIEKDKNCPNCTKSYKETKSEEKRIEQKGKK